MTITGGKKLYQSFFLFVKHFQPCSVVVYKKKINIPIKIYFLFHFYSSLM